MRTVIARTFDYSLDCIVADQQPEEVPVAALNRTIGSSPRPDSATCRSAEV